MTSTPGVWQQKRPPSRPAYTHENAEFHIRLPGPSGPLCSSKPTVDPGRECAHVHCTRCTYWRKAMEQLLRSDLLLTGIIFSERIDTEISFGYSILSPNAGVADLADVKQLQLKPANP